MALPPVAITWVAFIYIFSLGMFAAEVILLIPAGIAVAPISGGESGTISAFILNQTQNLNEVGEGALNPTLSDNPIDRVTYFIQAGQDAIWTVLSLMTASYMFTFLLLLGVHVTFVYILQLIFSLLIGATVIYYLMGKL